MGTSSNNFQSIISAQAVGTADVNAQAEAIRKLAESIDGIGTKSKKLNENPGFDKFAAGVKQGISDPLGAIGGAAEGALKSLGPVGVGASLAGVAFVAAGVAGLSFARDLATLGDEIGDMATRMGLTIQEANEFRFAMKFAGGDAGSLQGIMRKLSAEIEDGGKNLKEAGIDFRDVSTGAVRPMSQIVLELSQRLGSMTSTTERNALAIKVMGRSALEVLPDLLELNEGVKRARELGLGPTEADIKRWADYQKQIAEIDAQWDALTRKLKEPLAATVLFVLKVGGQTDLLQLLDPKGAALRNAGTEAIDPETTDLIAKLKKERTLVAPGAAAIPGLVQTAESDRRRVKLNDDQVLELLAGTTEEKLAEAKKKLEKLRSELKTGVFPEVNAPTQKAITEQQAVVKQLEARIEATKRLEAAEKSLQQFEEQMSEKELGPVAKIFAQRDALAQQGANKGRATDAALIGAGPVLAKEEDEGRKQLFEISLKAGKSALDQWDEVYRNVAKVGDQVLKDFKAAADAAVQANREIENINLQADRSNAVARSNKAIRIQELQTEPGGELQAVLAGYQERLRLAQEIYDLEITRADKETDANKRRVDYARAEADLKRQTADAEIERELRVLEIQRQRLDNLRNEAGRLFDALLQPNGFQKFAKDFLLGEARKIFQNAVVESLKGLSANVGLPGKIFQGTILGKDPLKGSTDLLKGSTDVLKASTDTNSTATDANTLALRDLTAALAGARAAALSPTSGGGGFSPVSGYSPSFATFQNRVSGGEQIGAGTFDAVGLQRNSSDLIVRGPAAETSASLNPDVYDPGLTHDQVVTPTAVTNASAAAPKGQGFSKAAGTGVALAAGAFGVYSGIKAGGPQGYLSAASSALATAALLDPEPISKAILGVAAFATGLATTVFGDPKAKRAKEIDSWLKTHEYQGPDPVSIVQDVKGRDISYDQRGNLRPIQVSNDNRQYHVSAIDSQDVSRFFEKNAGALNRGVTQAIREGGGMVPELAGALGLQ